MFIRCCRCTIGLGLLVIILSIKTVSAQKIPIFKDPDVDTTYIDLLPGKWSLRAFSSIPYQIFSITNEENDLVRYVPNNLLGVGLGFSYRFIILDLGFNLKREEQEATTRFDLQMSVIFQKLHADLYLQRYNGFELNKSPGGTNNFRKDIRSFAIGVNYYHNFNDKKLSLRSAFAGDQLQRKSSGTLAVGGYFSYYKLEADSSIIGSKNQPFFNEYSYITDNTLFEAGVSGGYAYSLILPKNFFFYSSVMPGLGINFGTVETAKHTYKPKIGPVPKLGLRASFGYAGKRIYLITSFISDYFFVDTGQGNQYRYNPGKIKLVFGYRLQSKVEFLEKVNEQFRAD